MQVLGLIHRVVRSKGRGVAIHIHNPKIDLGSLRELIDLTKDYVIAYAINTPYLLHHGVRALASLIHEYPDTYFLADVKLADMGDSMINTIETLANAEFKGITIHAFVGIEGALDMVVKKVRDLGIDLVLCISLEHSGSLEILDKIVADVKEIVGAIDPDAIIIPSSRSELIRDFRNSFGWKYIILASSLSMTVPLGEGLCSGADVEIVSQSLVMTPNPTEAVKELIKTQEKYLQSKSQACIQVPTG